MGRRGEPPKGTGVHSAERWCCVLGWAHLLGLSELSVGFTDAGGMECLTDFPRGVLLGR